MAWRVQVPFDENTMINIHVKRNIALITILSQVSILWVPFTLYPIEARTHDLVDQEDYGKKHKDNHRK